MSVNERLSDRRTVANLPTAASLAIAVGDLCYWDNSAKVFKPATSRTDLGSLAQNQADFTPIFIGVSQDQRLSTETSTGHDSWRTIIAEGIFDITCASATWEVGDLVGIDRSSTPLNYAQQVIKVTDDHLAIGQCVLRSGGSNVTTVRAWLSAYRFGWFRVPDGQVQTVGASTAAAGSSTSDATVLPVGTATIYPTTAADGTRGVKISVADQVTGRTLYIGNGVSNQILKVYGPTGAVINGASADAAFSSVSGKGVIITCLSGSGNTWLAW
jgi:hypothetical protein